MHDEELIYYSLKRIATAVERVIENSKNIDNSRYYVLSASGMERLERTCMLLLAIGESIKGIDKMTKNNSFATIQRWIGKEQWEFETLSLTIISTLKPKNGV